MRARISGDQYHYLCAELNGSDPEASDNFLHYLALTLNVEEKSELPELNFFELSLLRSFYHQDANGIFLYPQGLDALLAWMGADQNDHFLKTSLSHLAQLGLVEQDSEGLYCLSLRHSYSSPEPIGDPLPPLMEVEESIEEQANSSIYSSPCSSSVSSLEISIPSLYNNLFQPFFAAQREPLWLMNETDYQSHIIPGMSHER